MADDLARTVPDQDELLAALERENRRRVWLPMVLLILLPLAGAAAIWRFGLTRSEVLEAKVEAEVESEGGRRAISSAVAEQLATPVGTRAIRGGVAGELLNNPELRSGFERELSREIAGSEALSGALKRSIEAQLEDSERLAASLARSVGAALDRPEVRARLRTLAADEIHGDALREVFEARVVEELRRSDQVAGAVREVAKREVDGLLEDERVLRGLADELSKSEALRRSLGGAMWSDEAFRKRQRQSVAETLGFDDPEALRRQLEALGQMSEQLGALEQRFGQGLDLAGAAEADALRADLAARLAALEANVYRSLPLREGQPQELPALGFEVVPGEIVRDQAGAKTLSGFAIVAGGEPIPHIPRRLPLDAWHDFAWRDCVYRFRVSEVSRPILRDARLNLEINRTCDNGG